MLNNIISGALDLERILQQVTVQIEEAPAERTLVIEGPAWLDEPEDGPDGLPPETDGWTCPRCRSHRCMRTNPGDLEHATYCCTVCGYTFEATSAAGLPSAEDDGSAQDAGP